MDARLVRDWLTARSIVRGLPAPVPDRGGYRVDTGSTTEAKRWIFPEIGAGLADLARTIQAPGHLLKLCGTDSELRAILPTGWRLDIPRHFMISAAPMPERQPHTGYTLVSDTNGAVTHVRILSAAGELAADGWAVETSNVFIYDRIATALAHRRKGLGSRVMAALRQAKRSAALPELLVATDAGRALYEALAWRTLSPYSSASIVEA